jgi:hypothetical protein
MFLVLDLRGLNCPLPEPRTRKMLCLLAHGNCLIVEGTDPLAVIDIPHGLFIFHIKRGKAWEQRFLARGPPMRRDPRR